MRLIVRGYDQFGQEVQESIHVNCDRLHSIVIENNGVTFAQVLQPMTDFGHVRVESTPTAPSKVRLDIETTAEGTRRWYEDYLYNRVPSANLYFSEAQRRLDQQRNDRANHMLQAMQFVEVKPKEEEKGPW